VSPSDDLIDYPTNGSVTTNDSVNLYASENISNNEKDGEGSNNFQESEMNGEVNPEPIKKPKKTPKKILPGMNIGAYSDDEESLFLSGLELYGRDWKKVIY